VPLFFIAKIPSNLKSILSIIFIIEINCYVVKKQKHNYISASARKLFKIKCLFLLSAKSKLTSGVFSTLVEEGRKK